MPANPALKYDDCPHCASASVSTVDSRPGLVGRTRRKKCTGCGARWSTIEMRLDDVSPLLQADQSLSAAGTLLADAERKLRGIRETLESFA